MTPIIFFEYILALAAGLVALGIGGGLSTLIVGFFLGLLRR